MNRLLASCPVCGGRMTVSELSCSGCTTTVRSTFEACRFCGLSREQMEFLELFLSTRGNLSSVGEEMGISYPTVSKRLDAVLSTLGLGYENAMPAVPAAPVMDAGRSRILEMLDRGEITAEEATRRLQGL